MNSCGQTEERERERERERDVYLLSCYIGNETYA